jgi:hypothetical protein
VVGAAKVGARLLQPRGLGRILSCRARYLDEILPEAFRRLLVGA